METRRHFFLAGATIVAAQSAPSDQINLGVIGSGSRGTYVMELFQKDPAVRVSSICDVYEPNLEKALSVAARLNQVAPRRFGTTSRFWRTRPSRPC